MEILTLWQIKVLTSWNTPTPCLQFFFRFILLKKENRSGIQSLWVIQRWIPKYESSKLGSKSSLTSVRQIPSVWKWERGREREKKKNTKGNLCLRWWLKVKQRSGLQWAHFSWEEEPSLGEVEAFWCIAKSNQSWTVCALHTATKWGKQTVRVGAWTPSTGSTM